MKITIITESDTPFEVVTPYDLQRLLHTGLINFKRIEEGKTVYLENQELGVKMWIEPSENNGVGVNA